MGGDVSAGLEINNLQAEHSFDGLTSYSQSKLAMMVTMYEFAQCAQNSKVTITICYPGKASTNMTRNVTPEMSPSIMQRMFPLFKLITHLIMVNQPLKHPDHRFIWLLLPQLMESLENISNRNTKK